jgi:hypothetical protein
MSDIVLTHPAEGCLQVHCLAMESLLPIVGQEFVFAGTCLHSCPLATDIYVTVSYNFIRNYVIPEVEVIFSNILIILHLVRIVMCHISMCFEKY